MTTTPYPSDLSQALATGKVVTRDYHDQAVAYAVEKAERKAAVTIDNLRGLLEIADADRVARVCATLNQVVRSRAGKHGPDCWQRHAGCLANRLYDLLDGKRPDRTIAVDGVERPVETVTPAGGAL